MRLTHIITAGIVLGIFSTALLSQDDSDEPSRRQIELQLEFHFQRAKLLKARGEIMKSLSAAQTEQAKLELKSLNVRLEMARAELQQAEVQLEFHQRNLERAIKLHEKQVITDKELEEAKQHVAEAKLEIQKLRLEVERLKQEAANSELAIKRRSLDAELQMNEVQLELLEAEHTVKELKLELESR